MATWLPLLLGAIPQIVDLVRLAEGTIPDRKAGPRKKALVLELLGPIMERLVPDQPRPGTPDAKAMEAAVGAVVEYAVDRMKRGDGGTAMPGGPPIVGDDHGLGAGPDWRVRLELAAAAMSGTPVALVDPATAARQALQVADAVLAQASPIGGRGAIA